MKILRALLLAGCVATAAQAAPGNPADVAEFKSLMALAGKGNMEAQYRLGEMYEKGQGTDQDLSLAIIWYGKAALQGDKRANDRLSALDRSKSAEVKENEQSRVDSVMKALRQQEAGEAARNRTNRDKTVGDKTAADKAAAEARARQQAQQAQQEAATRAREKAASEAAAVKTRVEPTKPTVQTTAKPVELVRPAEPVKSVVQTVAKPAEPVRPAEAAKPVAQTVAKPATQTVVKPAEPAKNQGADSDKDEFSSNPCKGPQAKFLSTCN